MYYAMKLTASKCELQIPHFIFDIKLQSSTGPKVFKTAIETIETSKNQTLKFTNIAMSFIDPTVCKIALSMSILASERFGLILNER